MENIDSIARGEGALIRERKFSLSAYIIKALHKMCAPAKQSRFTLRSMHESYNILNPDKALSHKCIHKQLQCDETLGSVEHFPAEALTPYQSKAFLRDLKRSLPKDLDKLLSELKVKDIIKTMMTHALLSEPVFPKTDCVPGRFTCFTASDGTLNYSIKPTGRAPVCRVLTLRIKTSF